MNSDYLFVYGTLLKDFDSYMSKFLERNSDFIGDGYFNGKLFEVSWYPAAILSNISSEKVFGHIFKIHENDKTFKILDDYEGIGDTSECPNEYRRELINAYLNTGDMLKVWVYIYNQSTENLRFIPSGNYLIQD
ncbi:MAG: gamma-glutamylcyclotransferase [Flavobacteriaceae bacterium]|nr:gamma-glutamylcyclotransferase [Flavobacteriaceae bacterium]